MEPLQFSTFAAEARPLPIPAGEPVLTLFDTLGPGHADGHALAREVWRLEAEGAQRIHLRINSAGGSVAQGYSLFSALRHTRMEVHTWADGLALSMAGLIFLAGRHRHMAPWSMLMLHNPSLTAEGEREEPGNALILERIRNSVLKMYEGCTALSEESLGGMMDAETWLTASDAVELGLATDFAGQDSVPELETALRARAESGVAVLEAAVLEARPAEAASSIRLETTTSLAPASALEASLLSHLSLIEAQLAALQERLDGAGGAVSQPEQQRPAPQEVPERPGYVPLPPTPRTGGELSFRELERRDPQALSRMQQTDPSRFDLLYKAAYGRKGGAK